VLPGGFCRTIGVELPVNTQPFGLANQRQLIGGALNPGNGAVALPSDLLGITTASYRIRNAIRTQCEQGV
jgi:hypothetical protein